MKNTKKYEIGIVSEFDPSGLKNPNLRWKKIMQTNDLVYTYLNKYII